MLLADADLAHHDHAACDEHRQVWGHLYRRAVAVPSDSPVDEVDLREEALPAPLDLRDEVDDPRGRHEH